MHIIASHILVNRGFWVYDYMNNTSNCRSWKNPTETQYCVRGGFSIKNSYQRKSTRRQVRHVSMELPNIPHTHTHTHTHTHCMHCTVITDPNHQHNNIAFALRQIEGKTVQKRPILYDNLTDNLGLRRVTLLFSPQCPSTANINWPLYIRKESKPTSWFSVHGKCIA